MYMLIETGIMRTRSEGNKIEMGGNIEVLSVSKDITKLKKGGL